jgi:hypothetical protein
VIYGFIPTTIADDGVVVPAAEFRIVNTPLKTPRAMAAR